MCGFFSSPLPPNMAEGHETVFAKRWNAGETLVKRLLKRTSIIEVEGVKLAVC